MTFTTLTFLIFFGIVFFGYYLIPKKYQWLWLLAASIIFYLWASPVCILYLLGTVTVTYVFARQISVAEEEKDAFLKNCILEKAEKNVYKAKVAKKKKRLLVFGLVLLIGTLLIVKYTSFFLENVNKLAGALGKETNFAVSILMPIGISFYIFQNIGYLVDVYRGNYLAERSYLKFLLYISYFPHILQGPLDDYQKVSASLYAEHAFDSNAAVRGVQRAAWGFFKKLVVANQISLLISSTLTSGGSDVVGISVVFVMFLYAIQLYADFSSYMDVAIGCSQMLGIPIAENFDTPYFSGSIAEFWRRWHITLGTWIKNYVFYPVLRSGWCMRLRKSLKKHKYLANTVPTVIGLCITWLIIGFWHGASWNYVFYGVYHGGFIVLANIMEPIYNAFYAKFPNVRKNKLFRFFCIVRTFLIVVVGYYLFAPGYISLTVSLVKQTFAGFGAGNFVSFVYNNFRDLLVVGFGTIVMLLVDLYHAKPDRLPLRDRVAKIRPVWRYALYVVFLLVILFLGAYGNSNLNQFIYFRF